MKMRSSHSKRFKLILEKEEREPSRAVAELSAEALLNNYRVIRELMPKQAVLAMVKADAYGHGAAWTAKLLDSLESLYGFGVATLEEGSSLRTALGPRGRRTRIIVFSGTIPWTDEKGRYCEEHGLTPVIASEADWHRFLRDGWPERLPYELKFNTGMNRLGIPASLAASVRRSLKDKPTRWHPEGIFSHLAVGENPDAKLSRLQRDRFQAVQTELSSALPSSQFHLANSAGIWNQKGWRLDGLTDIVRPGLALYGVPPSVDSSARGLVPVMTLKAPVVAVHELRAGESVGYGGTYTVPPGQDERVAILAIGYGDGLHRALGASASSPASGKVWLGGRLEPILGVISMDLCAVRCSRSTQVGEWAEVMGANIAPWVQARAAGTIPYELLTSVAPRVQRKV